MNNSLIIITLIFLILIVIFILIRYSSKKNKPARESEFFPGQYDDPSDAMTSNVRFEHVDNLIKQDFPTEIRTEVAEALSKYDKGYKPTVYNIILKEAKGNLDKVKEYVKIAEEVGDYRDLAQALISLKSK